MVAEGGDATYTVVLNTLPPGSVTVTVSRTGDSDLTVSADEADVQHGELEHGGRRRR